jgi:hypothetical protein
MATRQMGQQRAGRDSPVHPRRVDSAPTFTGPAALDDVLRLAVKNHELVKRRLATGTRSNATDAADRAQYHAKASTALWTAIKPTVGDTALRAVPAQVVIPDALC